MNYKIIKDRKKLDRFIDWLPELNNDECYYVALFARKKYHPSAKNDKSQCKRFTATSKEWLIKKIKQVEIKDGEYTNKDGSPVHQDSLALYISVNPRSFRKAQKNLLIKLANTITEPTNVQNPSSLALSSIQKSKSRTVYVDFDFDTDVEFSEFKGLVLNQVNESAIAVVNTRGGFHILVDPSKVDEKYSSTWYKGLSSLPDCDVSGDNLIPVVGCTQGGFTPELLIINNN